MNVRITKFEYFLRLLFPVRCICCDIVLPISATEEVCTHCQKSLKILKENAYESMHHCSFCKIFSVFSYEGGIREAIHRLKFNDNPHVASVLIDLSFPILKKYLYSFKPLEDHNGAHNQKTPCERPTEVSNEQNLIFHKDQTPYSLNKQKLQSNSEQSHIILKEENIVAQSNYDIIIPAPLHPARKRKRGYNQSELLASRLAFHLKIPMLRKTLVKKVNTAPQSTLGRGERLKNLIGVFQVKNPNEIQNQRILLVDDITTTGSTLEKCAKVLLDAGAAHIDAYVVAMRRRL